MIAKPPASRLRAWPWTRVDPATPLDSTDLVCGDCFTVEHLEVFAADLARTHDLAPSSGRGGRAVLVRVRHSGDHLLKAVRTITRESRAGLPISPAAEWLVDNYPLLEEQVRDIRQALPLGYYQELPRLARGPFAGLPRILAVIWGYLQHCDARFDPAVLSRYLVAYQRVRPLAISELWAVAIALRVVLVENLRRLSDRIVARRAARFAADALADALLDPARADGWRVQLWLRRLQGSPLPVAFTVQLIQRLRGTDPLKGPGLQWLELQLARYGTTVEEVVLEEHRRQAAVPGPVRDCISSLRALGAVDWGAFVEEVGIVDAILRDAGVGASDFHTRDRYRHVIEDLARHSTTSEVELATLVLARVRTDGVDPGTCLVGPGRRALEVAISYQPPLRQRALLQLAPDPGLVYLAALTLATALVLLLPLWAASRLGATLGELALFGVLGLIPATELATGIVHRLVCRTVPPHRLAKLALLDGVPEQLRTMVVVPVLLTDAATVTALVDRLEVHFLANDDGALHFALLSDYPDADEAVTAADDALLAACRQGVAALNQRHGPAPGGDLRFFVFHRERRWNPQEGRWMGWERKRGKLRELDRLLRGDAATSFVGGGEGADPGALAAMGFRFVLTLDADTRVPRGAARRLVGAMAHPLNAPRHDPVTGRVVAGYGILQPRVTPTLPGRDEGSVVRWVAAGRTGIDPYAWAVSDVYQDLFEEGSFTGKGIYDLDAFERALGDHVPDNTLLSHDLLEGLYARAGLLSDVELFDDPPADQQVVDARAHRWTRGDWQLLPWIFGRSGIPTVGRFKMLDNLRRSLLAPASLTLLVASWSLPDARAAVWSLAAVVAVTGPVLGPAALDLVPLQGGLLVRSALSDVSRDALLAVTRSGLELLLLAERAWQMGDAISRTLYRLAVSRRNLLAWVTAAHVQDNLGRGLGATYLRMAPGALFGAVVVTLALAGVASPWALGFGVTWVLAPLLAREASRTWVPDALDPAIAARFRKIGRRTWSWFERVVTAADHHLPPDNTQEDPPAVAHRTSPTNIGMYLLAATSAHDSGWLGRAELFDRLTATLGTLTRMELHRGHLYNWYDTTDLRPLPPRYVSTVDSGNLAGHLLAVREACFELARGAGPQRGHRGLDDTLALLSESVLATGADRADGPFRTRQLDDAANEVATANVREGVGWDELVRRADLVVDTARALTHDRAGDRWDDALAAALVVRATAVSHARDAVEAPSEHAWRALGEALGAFARQMDFTFLYDRKRQLFSLGYQREEDTLDRSSYDLLASEVRLASFVAIAHGQVPASHWFRLGRRLVPTGGGVALVSWSGSMFEYLMPDLVLASPVGSLLESTLRRVVEHQIRYGQTRGVPWGVSESAYNARDLGLTYQYGPFGVEGLGLKHLLGGDLVIAPYATALAAMVDPVAADLNFMALAKARAAGRYGFHESVDYTRARLPDDSPSVVVKAWMAHHQGMTIVALGNVVDGFAMRKRFHDAPEIRATALLLHERPPHHVPAGPPHGDDTQHHQHVLDVVPAILHVFQSPHSPIPATHRLSNGRYSVSLSTAGAGQSRWNDLAVTRWREDETLDAWGSFVYVAELVGDRAAHTLGRVWSVGHQPTGAEPSTYEVSFEEHRVTVSRRDGSIATRLEVVVSPVEDGELRKVELTNHGMHPRAFEVTSYAEVVLAPQAADVVHPAFSNLFVETSFDPGHEALLATRRTRLRGEAQVWAAHTSTVYGDTGAGLQFESDRMRFVGRGRTVRTARAVFDGHHLSNTVGAVLDPVFSLRRTVTVAPGETVRVVFATLVGTDRGRLLAVVDAWRDPGAFERVAGEAWTRAQAELRHQGLEVQEAMLYQRLGSRLTYPGPALRASREVLLRNVRGQASLWRFGISGDRPILLASVVDVQEVEFVRQLVCAVAYWRGRGLVVDLVLLDEQPHSYFQATLDGLVRTSHGLANRDGLHLLRAEQLTPEDRDLLFAAARVVVTSSDGALDEQVHRLLRSAPAPRPALAVVAPPHAAEERAPEMALSFFNGIGGFDRAGAEYVVVLGARQWTPLPWVNVIANEAFGFVVSESGGGYTWSGNSKENQLTPWANDPVGDAPGEVLYLRDEATGEIWNPTPLPVREATPYVTRHGQGYTSFQHVSHGISSELTQFVAADDPVKLSRLVLTNRSGATRQLTVAVYVEWVLGPARPVSTPFVVTSTDEETGALFATNTWVEEGAGRVAFLDLGGRQTVRSGDRAEWIGRNGTLAAPAGLSLLVARGRVGAGMDSCGVLQTTLTLAPGATQTVVVLLGQAPSAAEARRLVGLYRARPAAEVLAEGVARWEEVLQAVQIRTPDPSMDILVNRWLPYQVLSCRLWARTALSQAGGAYGFRDQLQDVMALVLSRPGLAREHLLRAAAHQFEEGDVLHWWHPPADRGVRTRFSDDRVWLPFVAHHYVTATGDTAVLDATAPFVEGPALAEGVDDDYRGWKTTTRVASLYEHAALALDVSLRVGAHGLPLIGSGDWNDGMNRIGAAGAGESVWLAWFLITTLEAWIPLAEARGDAGRALTWREAVTALTAAAEAAGWDGAWYRRAFTDDATPIGSASSIECRIDSLAQSWAVLSGAAQPDRARRAMASVDEHLVRRADGVILLLTPPFDQSALDPGYIRGYLPGVRENGGQYTHAAIWVVMAYAAMGDGNQAGELFAMLNPIDHTRTRAGVQRYKAEPYAIAADVYGAGTHVGRGGWSWYTGSASWMYRAALESILGIHVRGDHLHVAPCVPAAWPGFEVALRLGGTCYDVVVTNPNHVQRGVVALALDGAALDPGPGDVPLAGDGGRHRIEVTLG